MIPFIVAGIAIIATGSYILNEAQSQNRRTRQRYDSTANRSKQKAKKHYEDSRKKDALDKLFKVKKAKVKIANSIYLNLEEERNSLKEMSMEIQSLKMRLNELFNKKKSVDIREEKQEIQNHINTMITSKKELFKIKDSIQNTIKELKHRLYEANADTRLIQEEINSVLSR